MQIKSFLCGLLLYTVTSIAHAGNGNVIETIILEHRTAEQILPILEPVLSADSKVSGTGYKLIINASANEIAYIKQILKEVDIKITEMLISVSTVAQRQSRVSVERTTKDDSDKIKYNEEKHKQYQTQRYPIQHQIRVREGSWATIKTDYTTPIVTRTQNTDGTVTQTMTYQYNNREIRIFPEIHNDQVVITVETIDSGNQTSPSFSTQVSGKLGEWIDVGSTDKDTQITNTLHLKIDLIK